VIDNEEQPLDDAEGVSEQEIDESAECVLSL
jgi:hypothetical protein